MIWERKKCSYYRNDLRYIHSVIKYLLKAYYEPGSVLEMVHTRHSNAEKRHVDKKRAMKCFNCCRSMWGNIWGPKSKKVLN